MTSETGVPDPYELVLADLRAKRGQIDEAIRVIESLRSSGSAAPAPASLGATHKDTTPLSSDTGSLYLGMSIADAAKKLLEARHRTLGNAEIATSLRSGGLIMNSADPVNTIGSVLTRRFNQVGDIVKVGRGVWGLKEWYPNRSFKTKGGVENAAKTETSEPAPPSEPTPGVPQGEEY